MARSPTDATRFTATGPYAASPTPSFSSNPSPSVPLGTQIHIPQSSAPANETPQQKIARLRAAAAASRLANAANEPVFDRVVRIGRVVADRAHRTAAYGLIGLTVVSGCVAVAGITDMLVHNRRRRNEWMAEQRARAARDLAEAVQAERAGVATEDQMLLINRERAAREAEEERKNRPGILKRMTASVFGGFAKEEQKGGRLGAEARGEVVHAEELLGEREDKGVLQAVQEKVEKNRRAAEKVEETLRPSGGPLDREAERASAVVLEKSKSWTGWLTGR